jgi:hypothetical protein
MPSIENGFVFAESLKKPGRTPLHGFRTISGKFPKLAKENQNYRVRPGFSDRPV